MTTCPHCARPIPPDMAHICTAHLTPEPATGRDLLHRARVTVAAAVELLDGNWYDVYAAQAHLRRLLADLNTATAGPVCCDCGAQYTAGHKCKERA